jgi:hypothetical protein
MLILLKHTSASTIQVKFTHELKNSYLDATDSYKIILNVVLMYGFIIKLDVVKAYLHVTVFTVDFSNKHMLLKLNNEKPYQIYS